MGLLDFKQGPLTGESEQLRGIIRILDMNEWEDEEKEG